VRGSGLSDPRGKTRSSRTGNRRQQLLSCWLRVPEKPEDRWRGPLWVIGYTGSGPPYRVPARWSNRVQDFDTAAEEKGMSENDLTTLLAAVLTEYEEECDFLGRGRSRAVFQLDCNSVVKVPLNMAGIVDNSDEARLFSRYGKTGFIPYAVCEVVLHKERESLSEIPLLMMELIRLPEEFEKLPEWCDYVDCAQVGYDGDNKLVAYDFGPN